MLKLEVGKTYVSILKKKFRVVAERRVGSLAGVARFISLSGNLEDIEMCYYHHTDGTSPLSSDYNLVSEFREPDYRWFNVYKQVASMALHEELRVAKIFAHGSSSLVGTYRIDLSTGDIIREVD